MDVGSGTGYMSALCSTLVGSAGCVTGWEISEAAVHFARKVWATRPELSHERMAPVTFECRDCFDCIALAEQGQFDAVIVGAAIPPSAVRHLTQLVRRPNGVLVAPIEDALVTVSWNAETGKWNYKAGLPVRFRSMTIPAPKRWSTNVHRFLPMHVRKAIFTCLCIWTHSTHPLSQLPEEILFHIFRWVYEQGVFQEEGEEVMDDDE